MTYSLLDEELGAKCPRIPAKVAVTGVNAFEPTHWLELQPPLGGLPAAMVDRNAQFDEETTQPTCAEKASEKSQDVCPASVVVKVIELTNPAPLAYGWNTKLSAPAGGETCAPPDAVITALTTAVCTEGPPCHGEVLQLTFTEVGVGFGGAITPGGFPWGKTGACTVPPPAAADCFTATVVEPPAVAIVEELAVVETGAIGEALGGPMRPIEMMFDMPAAVTTRIEQFGDQGRFGKNANSLR